MRKTEHLLRLSFDEEYQLKWKRWESRGVYFLRKFNEVFLRPATYLGPYFITIGVTLVVYSLLSSSPLSISGGAIGLGLGIGFATLLPVPVFLIVVAAEKRKIGLPLVVWPW